MKKDIAELRLELDELRSCMVILKKAADNEDEEILSSDVSNYLEMAINKIEQVIIDFDKTIELFNIE